MLLSDWLAFAWVASDWSRFIYMQCDSFSSVRRWNWSASGDLVLANIANDWSIYFGSHSWSSCFWSYFRIGSFLRIFKFSPCEIINLVIEDHIDTRTNSVINRKFVIVVFAIKLCICCSNHWYSYFCTQYFFVMSLQVSWKPSKLW